MGACLSTSIGPEGEREMRLAHAAEKEMREAKKQITQSSKILLLGSGDSGKSTVLKQMRIINNVSWTQEELESYRLQIYQNLVQGMKALLDMLRDMAQQHQHQDVHAPSSYVAPYGSTIPASAQTSSTAVQELSCAPTAAVAATSAYVAAATGRVSRSASISSHSTKHSTVVTSPSHMNKQFPSHPPLPISRRLDYTPRIAQLHAILEEHAHDLKDGEVYPRETFDVLVELWGDQGSDVRECWDRAKVGAALPDNLEYFIPQLSRLFETDYVPTEQDIVHCRIRTIGITETVFTLKKGKTGSLLLGGGGASLAAEDSASRQPSTSAAAGAAGAGTPAVGADKSRAVGPALHVVDVGGQKSERRKWIHCFEDVTAVLFLASLSGYCQCLVEDEHANQMQDAMTIWDGICSSQWFRFTSIILFLNKADLFEERIPKAPIRNTFPDYDGALGDVEAGKEYFKKRFLRLAAKGARTARATTNAAASSGVKKGRTGFAGHLRGDRGVDDDSAEARQLMTSDGRVRNLELRKVYPHFTNATDTKMLRNVMVAVTDIVLRDNFSRSNII